MIQIGSEEKIRSVADLELEIHWCQAAFAAWRCAREVCIGACRCGIHACMLAPCMQFRKAVLRLGSSKFEPSTCSTWPPGRRGARESTPQLGAHRAAEGRARDPTSARVWRAGPLPKNSRPAPGSFWSLGGPIWALGCQTAPAGSHAITLNPP